MQNTITRERTLQYVEAGQVLVLKGVGQNNTNSIIFFTFSLRMHLAGKHYWWDDPKKKEKQVSCN